MDIGARLKQARLEAGLSQRQLCGDTITRNMLSQIENGAARPSMDTLRYFAGRLQKPMAFFLEEQPPLSPNQALLDRARQADAGAVLACLQEYQAPDPVFDRERYLLEAMACLELAQTAILENRRGYAQSLLDQARAAGAQTPYYTPELERRRLLLLHRAQAQTPGALAALLPDLSEELLLRAAAALEAGDCPRCRAILEAADTREGPWNLLMAESWFAQGEYALAVPFFRRAESWNPKTAWPRLEHCFRELEDFKSAYEYACKQRH